MIIECIQTDSKFQSLKEEWNRLLLSSKNDNIFLTWEWLGSWWQSFKGTSELFTLAARDTQKRLIGIAPLMISRQSYHGIPFRQLQFIGSGEASSDYLGFVVAPDQEEVIRELLVYLWDQIDKWDVFSLTDILKESRILEIGKKWAEANRWKYIIERGLPCPYIPLVNSWEEYSKTLKGKMRYEMRRRLNLLKKNHKVRFVLWQDKKRLESAMENFFKLHAIRWDMNGNITSRRNVKEFHQRIASLFSGNNWLRLYFLEVDTNPIAALYGFEYQEKFFHYNAGFNTQWSKYGVAKQLLACVIEDSIKRSLREFDFLKGSEEYKYEWTRYEKETMQIEIFNENVRSRLYWAARRSIRALKLSFKW